MSEAIIALILGLSAVFNFNSVNNGPSTNGLECDPWGNCWWQQTICEPTYWGYICY